MKSDIKGAGETVVLVPGGLTGWLSWEAHAKELSKNHKVVRLQLLNVDFGLRNEPLPEDYSVDYEVRALTNALDQKNIDKAHFAAWSYGGLVALTYALNNPGRVKTLTLIEPAAKWVLDSRGPLPKEFIEQGKKMRSLGTGNITESQLEWFAREAGLVPSGIEPKEAPQWPNWVKHRQSLRIGDAPYRHKDRIDRVRNFNNPVLLIKGEDSAKYDKKIVEILSEEFPQAQAITLPGDHASHIISMKKFLEIYTSFIESK